MGPNSIAGPCPRELTGQLVILPALLTGDATGDELASILLIPS